MAAAASAPPPPLLDAAATAQAVQTLQEVTGVADETHCRQVLEAHAWDVNAAASTLLAVAAADREHFGGASAGDLGGGIGGGDAAAAAAGRLGVAAGSSGGTSLARSAGAGGGATAATAGGAGGAGGGGGGPIGNSNLRARTGGLVSGGSGGGGIGGGGGGGGGSSPAAAGATADGATGALPPAVSAHRSGRAPVRASHRNSSSSLLSRLLSLPFWVLRGGLGVMASLFGLGLWAAGGVLSTFFASLSSVTLWLAGGPHPYSGHQGTIGVLHPSQQAGGAAQQQAQRGAGGGGGGGNQQAQDAAVFRQRFEAEFGTAHPEFFPGSFADALRRSGEQFRFLLVYLHAPEHAATPRFCRDTLCDPEVVRVIDEQLVLWAADVRSVEGFQMSHRLHAVRFPFLALITAAPGGRVALLQQVRGARWEGKGREGSGLGGGEGKGVEGTRERGDWEKREARIGVIQGYVSAGELRAALERAVEDHGAVLVAARADAEERALTRRLREEQDAAFHAALLADQEREREREEAARKQREEEAAAARRAEEEAEQQRQVERAAAEKAAVVERRRSEAMGRLGEQPEKGPDTTQVLIRMPGGERKERRFLSSDRVQALYDYVDSEALGSLLPSHHYLLVSNFPRTVYDAEKRSKTLQEAGLHPHASLFVQMEEEPREDVERPVEPKGKDL
ncbi:unnamed protein product [Closterium sp. Naga37s-1]|nr:unnamed protein product [Closterium sp. Naga37s-1]